MSEMFFTMAAFSSFASSRLAIILPNPKHSPRLFRTSVYAPFPLEPAILIIPCLSRSLPQTKSHSAFLLIIVLFAISFSAIMSSNVKLGKKILFPLLHHQVLIYAQPHIEPSRESINHFLFGATLFLSLHTKKPCVLPG